MSKLRSVAPGAPDLRPPEGDEPRPASNRQSAEQLRRARRELRDTVAELGAANEELRCANEELLAGNEELRSAGDMLARHVAERDQALADLANLLDTTEAATIFLDHRLCLRRFTPAATRIFPFVAADVGRSIGDLICRLPGFDLAAEAATALRDSTPVDRELPGPGGTWYLLRLRPYTTSSGAVGGVVATFVDLSARRQMEDHLRESETRFRLMADTAPTMIWMSDEAGANIYVNLPWTAFTGQSVDDAAGSGWQEVIHPEDRATCMDAFETAAPAREPFTVVMRVRRKDGVYRWHLNTGTLRSGSDEVMEGFIGCCVDIDDRKRAAETLASLNATLERKVEERTSELRSHLTELDSFNYSISHDLRAPLRAIDGFGNALAEEYGALLEGAGQHYLARIRSGAQRMGQLIDGLLTLTRSTQAELHREAVSLSALAAEVIDELRQSDPGRAVQCDIAPGLEAMCDATLLRAVLANLLGNAWKFTRGSSTARIEFGALDRVPAPVYFVRDNGAGFDMAYVENLFRPFRRLHGDEFPGTGIGLATLRRIIGRHAGTAWAEGAQGRGATIYFTLSAGA